MSTRTAPLRGVGLVACSFISPAVMGPLSAAAQTLARPPLAEKPPVCDVYFGNKIVDSYPRMEALGAPIVTWMKAPGSLYARGTGFDRTARELPQVAF